jgi:hypothetical protein
MCHTLRFSPAIILQPYDLIVQPYTLVNTSSIRLQTLTKHPLSACSTDRRYQYIKVALTPVPKHRVRTAQLQELRRMLTKRQPHLLPSGRHRHFVPHCPKYCRALRGYCRSSLGPAERSLHHGRSSPKFRPSDPCPLTCTLHAICLLAMRNERACRRRMNWPIYFEVVLTSISLCWQVMC